MCFCDLVLGVGLGVICDLYFAQLLQNKMDFADRVLARSSGESALTLLEGKTNGCLNGARESQVDVDWWT